MDFGLSEDQRMLEDTIRSFLADRVPITRVRELRDAPCPNDRKIWRELAELGRPAPAPRRRRPVAAPLWSPEAMQLELGARH